MGFRNCFAFEFRKFIITSLTYNILGNNIVVLPRDSGPIYSIGPKSNFDVTEIHSIKCNNVQ